VSEIYRFGDASVILFLAALGAGLWLAGQTVVQAIRRRWEDTRRSLARLGALAGIYALALAGVSLTTPRQLRAAGERHCFDDLCFAALTAAPVVPAPASCQAPAGSRTWAVTVHVSNRGRGRQQRARDATAALEDLRGRHYPPCPSPANLPTLSDSVRAGESFAVSMLFVVPESEMAAGVVVSHGAFPDVLIIGADQGWLHPRTLLGVRVIGAP